MSSEQKNPERIAAGLKSTVHSARTSDDAKLNAAQRLDEMGVGIEQQGSTHSAFKDVPATGEAKKGAYTAVSYTDDPAQADQGVPRRQMGTSLDTSRDIPESYAGMDADNFGDDNDPDTFNDTGRSRGPDSGQAGEHRVMGGYRATLKNPRVSQQAKDHAKEVLQENAEPR